MKSNSLLYHSGQRLFFQYNPDVDENFDRMVEMVVAGAIENGSPHLSEDGRVPPIPAIATHDENRINFAIKKVEESSLPKSAIEFQMLHGIRRELQESLVAQGYPVRVYVPFGVEWYPYYTRRLAERPANLWFFLSNYLRS